MSIPILDLSLADDPKQRDVLLEQLRDTLFNIGFLYIKNHGVTEDTISQLSSLLPALFDLPDHVKSNLSKLNSPHFLGYSGFAAEITQNKQDLREQFDFATELPVVYQEHVAESGRNFSQLYWRLRGPNQWPSEEDLPGFRAALQAYHDALSELSYKFVHLVEEAFDIPVGTFDRFFGNAAEERSSNEFLSPQHRLKLVKYRATQEPDLQGVGPHKDSSGWLTFLYQVGDEKGLEVLDKTGEWISANPIPGTFVVNFGNALEAATEGAVRATIHRVKAPVHNDRYSIPFFMGLPLDMKVSEIRSFIPARVRSMRQEAETSEGDASVSTFLDPRWDSLGESQLRKWIRSHPEIGLKWYGPEIVKYYMAES